MRFPGEDGWFPARFFSVFPNPPFLILLSPPLWLRGFFRRRKMKPVFVRLLVWRCFFSPSSPFSNYCVLFSRTRALPRQTSLSTEKFVLIEAPDRGLISVFGSLALSSQGLPFKVLTRDGQKSPPLESARAFPSSGEEGLPATPGRGRALSPLPAEDFFHGFLPQIVFFLRVSV